MRLARPATLVLAFTLAAAGACKGRDDDGAVAAAQAQTTEAPGSGSGEAAPALPVEAPPPPPDEPIEPEQIAPVLAEPATGMVLAPAFRTGSRVRRHVTWMRTSDLDVATDDRNTSARIDAAVEAVYEVRVTEVDKGAPTTVEVRFESFSRTVSGGPSGLPDDPAAGDVWTCRTDRSPSPCATSSSPSRHAPAWLVLAFDALLPARRVEPGETWSRRVGVAPLLGFGPEAVARARITAEPPYETTAGLFSTMAIRFDADDVVQAFGRTLRMRANGEGAMEFDLRRGHVVAYDVEWTGHASAERRNHGETLGYERSSTLVLRMTELPAAP